MADQFVTTSTTGYFQRILNSFAGILFGLALFIGSFVLLFWNEGHYDLSQDAKKAVQIEATQSPDANLNNKLIAVTGQISSNETLGDGLYLKPTNILAINRKVEIYEWNEKQQTNSQTNIGGSQNNTTTYTYNLEWTDFPHDSTQFKYPAGHENPAKTVADTTLRVNSAHIGNYSIDIQTIDLPPLTRISLSQDNVNVATSAASVSPDYVYAGHGTLTTPQLGDMRTSYTGLFNGVSLTAIGSQNNTTISSYYDSRGHKLYRLFQGSLGDAISTLHHEYNLWIWIFRGVGFAMMWVGLMMFFGPISVILDVLPVFGGISRGAIGFLTFILSIILSIVTILVSMILHNVIYLIGAVIIAFLVFMVFAYFRQVTAGASSSKNN